MPFAIVELELTDPLPTVQLLPQQDGVAFIVRAAHRPVGFVMERLAPGTYLSAGQVGALVHECVGDAWKSLEPVAEAPLPPLTVAICTREHPDDLSRCLARLLAIRDGGLEFEILVVDNAPSSDRTRNVVRAVANARYTVEPKPGLNFARNHALRAATGKWIAFVDDDVLVDRHWLRGLRHALGAHPDAGAVTGLVLPAELETEAQILFELRGGFEKSYRTIRYESTHPYMPYYPCVGGKFGTGCNMCFRREALVELGGFDDALDTGAALPGGGDTDMLYRVVRAGHPLIYEPQFLVRHRHRREYEALRRQYCRSWGQGLMAFVTKTYRTDPEQRANLRGLVNWWFRYELGAISRSLSGRSDFPADLLIAELWGGIVGLLGAYGRSVRRVEAIRSRSAAAGMPHVTQS